MIRHVILDRDGTLNVSLPEGVKTPKEWEWLPGSRGAVVLLANLGIRVSVATNQSAVGRGWMTKEALAKVHDHMQRDCEHSISRIFHCPHVVEDRCKCRKPQPTMLELAVLASNVPKNETVMVGDSWCDHEAARRYGIPFCLVLTGNGRTVNVLRTFQRVSSDLWTFATDLQELER